MSAARPRSVTSLLADLSSGDPSAYDALLPLVYGELRRIAGRMLAGERRGHTLSATALVHEAYLRLVKQDRATFFDRAHFLAVAALSMRRILVTHARARQVAKRGGGARPVSLPEAHPARALDVDELVAIEQVLERLEALSERQGKVVVYRFYGGLTDEEIAHVLQVSLPTVRRDWRAARAWLTRELERGP